MENELKAVEDQIFQQRKKIDAWLLEAYADKPDQCYYGEMDASYPDWGDVERLVGSIFDEGLLTKLSDRATGDILFFISRGEELGRILGWFLSNFEHPLSGVGKLSHSDFIFLCNCALRQKDDFCDYQLVCCFQKQTTINEYEERVIHDFFHKKTDSYTRRMAIHTLAKFKCRSVVDLIKNLWGTDDCEFAKLSCLHSLEPFVESQVLFRKFLSEYQVAFPIEAANYRQVHMKRLLEILDNFKGS